MKTAWILHVVSFAFVLTGISLSVLGSATNGLAYAIASGVCAVLALICLFVGGESLRRIRVRKMRQRTSGEVRPTLYRVK